MHVGCGLDCLETGRSCEHRTNAAVADERGLHTRPGDLFLLCARLHGRKSQAFRDPPIAPAACRSRHTQCAGNRYEYRSLKRFAQEAWGSEKA